VTPGGGMTVDVNGGIAVIQGYLLRVDEDGEGSSVNVMLPTANQYDPRIDRIVLRLDRRIERRIIEVAYKMGVPGSGVPPALERNPGVWELSLAQVSVAAGQAGILGSDITDERFDSDLCGLINTLLRLDTTSWQTLVDQTLAAQITKFDGAFADWEIRLGSEYGDHESELAFIRGEFADWFAAAKLEIGLAAAFDFDNYASRPTTEIKTTVNGESITTEITNALTGELIASREIIFDAGGTITTEEKVYGEQGALLRDVSVTTLFGEGEITEIVV